MQKKYLIVAITLPVLCLLAVLVYFLPPVHDRLGPRLDEWKLRVAYELNPPEQQVFVPQANATALPATPTPLASATPSPAVTDTPSGPTSTPEPSPTPTTAATPLPEKVQLEGVRYEDQHGRWNYCAPSTLSMALSFWGFEGNRDTVGPVIKPNSKDKNVMPYEMVDYTINDAGLGAILRSGGDIETLKRFIAAGFPVLVEKGVYFRDISGIVSWMGHYEVFDGYDDAGQVFNGQDAFIGPDQQVPYEEVIKSWRAFNNIYMVIYPPEREAEIMAILGDDADETANMQRAAQKASEDIYQTSGIDQYFAWFNRGSSLTQLQDYAGGRGRLR